MKRLIGLAVSVSVLSACWGAPPNEKILTGLCQDAFVGDEQIANMLAGESGTDLDTFCSCYAATIVTDPVKTSLHKDVLNAIAVAREGASRGAEDAADRVEDLIESGEIDTFTEDHLEATGDELQRISESMNENGGVCPV